MANSAKPGLGQRLRYEFDNTMAAGTIALIGWLGLLSLGLILIASGFVILVGIKPEGNDNFGFIEAFWMSLLRTLDPGTMGGDAGWGFRLVMLAVTMGGIFIVATLIGILTTGIESTIDELRKGRSVVLESNHTLILGWSPKIYSIISELVIANENQKKPRIVILADSDKVEMEDDIRAKIPQTRNTKVICRSGSPIDLDDLEIVNPQASKSIIILASNEQNPDTETLKTLLAITNNPKRRAEPYHIVAEVRDPKNLEVAKMVGRDEVELVLSEDLIARITVQTCRQSGLSVVYTELLDFDGDEIYFQEEPKLTGKTFGESLFLYEDACVMGLRFRDGRIQVNPPMETVIAAGDKVIAIAEDDDKVQLTQSSRPPINEKVIREEGQSSSRPERTLILGWNQKGRTIVTELDNYVAPGSETMIVADASDAAEAVKQLRTLLVNSTVGFEMADTTDRRTLDSLAIPTYEHIIVLGYTDKLPPQEADANTLITLLHLRNIEEKTGDQFTIVSEMLDVRNRELAEVTKADDFIVSDKLISLMLSQLSENKELSAVFADLFDADGSEIYLKPATNYIEPNQPITFYTALEAARRRGEIAIGFRIAAEASNAEKAYGVVINPTKSETFTLAAGDKLIVIAES
ncbi:MAG: NAD-binding protein [Blastocatellia bacterium]|nr:NAD-binding protein [Blastocatellia bacterium]